MGISGGRRRGEERPRGSALLTPHNAYVLPILNTNARAHARSHGAAASATLASSGDGRSAFQSETRSAADVSNPTLHTLLNAQRFAPNILSVDHWARILHGELFAPSSRPEWAPLLRRTFRVDVRTCPHCGGRLTIRSLLSDTDAIASFLHPLAKNAHPRAPPAAT